jgi:membrane-associated phospholipid phosphatase
MNRSALKSKLKPHLWYQAYWLLYLVWFFALDLTVKSPKYIIHSSLDDKIPFCEWFVFPYCSWFLLLAGVMAVLWWTDTPNYDRLCKTMFSGMTFCLIVYMILPNGLNIRPVEETLERQNIAMTIMRMLWKADASVNVCPSIHCQSTVCMSMAFARSKPAQKRPVLQIVAWVWGALICISTVFTKQHSVIDVVCGVLVAVLSALLLDLIEKRRVKQTPAASI